MSRWRLLLILAVLIVLPATFVSITTSHSGGVPETVTGRVAGSDDAADVRGYWSKARLKRARARGVIGNSKVAKATDSNARVGALFDHDQNGDHFCTASVIDSPHGDLLITAAHCVQGGHGGPYSSDIAFVPGYRDGTIPEGVWLPRTITIDPRWAASADPDLDVAFVALGTYGGRHIGDVLGADHIAFNRGFRHLVRVTGYPRAGEEPITCVNTTSALSPTQQRFPCTGFTAGTSGSPWLTDFDPKTRTGSVIGVVGGYQTGGDTDDVSYSTYFGNDVQALYRKAIMTA